MNSVVLEWEDPAQRDTLPASASVCRSRVSTTAQMQDTSRIALLSDVKMPRNASAQELFQIHFAGDRQRTLSIAASRARVWHQPLFCVLAAPRDRLSQMPVVCCSSRAPRLRAVNDRGEEFLQPCPLHRRRCSPSPRAPLVLRSDQTCLTSPLSVATTSPLCL